MENKTPFGSVRFITETTEDMEKILMKIHENEEWIESSYLEDVDFTEVLLTTKDDDLNIELFDEDISEKIEVVLEEVGVDAKYKVVYEGENPDDNFILDNGTVAQQYRLAKSDSYDYTYQAHIIDLEEGTIALAWFDEADTVGVEAYYKGQQIYLNCVFLDVDASGEECYEQLDSGCFSVTIDDVFVADSVEEFANLTDEEITEYYVASLKENPSHWKSFKYFCEEIFGLDEDLPDNIDFEDLKFKIVPCPYEKSIYAKKANNISETTAFPEDFTLNDLLKQESLKKETLDLEPLKKETLKNEVLNQETPKKETLKIESPNLDISPQQQNNQKNQKGKIPVCPQCNNRLPMKAAFCPICGAQIPHKTWVHNVNYIPTYKNSEFYHFIMSVLPKNRISEYEKLDGGFERDEEFLKNHPDLLFAKEAYIRMLNTEMAFANDSKFQSIMKYLDDNFFTKLNPEPFDFALRFDQEEFMRFDRYVEDFEGIMETQNTMCFVGFTYMRDSSAIRVSVFGYYHYFKEDELGFIPPYVKYMLSNLHEIYFGYLTANDFRRKNNEKAARLIYGRFCM